MARRSRIIVIFPVVLLLVRSLLPVAQGQLLSLERNLKGDPANIYKQQMNLPAAERLFLSNLPVKQWNSPVDSTSINFNRDRDWVEASPSLLKNLAYSSQQLSPSVFIAQEQKHPSQNSILSYPSIDLMEALNNKLVYQHPKKRQDQQKEVETLLTGSGPSVDYSTDDDTSVQPVVPNPVDYPQPTPPKPKLKPRQAAVADGLARYLIFSNLKRARDGYICHFKLCQVGVSGKRLSNM